MGRLWLKGPLVPFKRAAVVHETLETVTLYYYLHTYSTCGLLSFVRLVSRWSQAVLGLTLPIPQPQWTKLSEKKAVVTLLGTYLPTDA